MDGQTADKDTPAIFFAILNCIQFEQNKTFLVIPSLDGDMAAAAPARNGFEKVAICMLILHFHHSRTDINAGTAQLVPKHTPSF